MLKKTYILSLDASTSKSILAAHPTHISFYSWKVSGRLKLNLLWIQATTGKFKITIYLSRESLFKFGEIFTVAF